MITTSHTWDEITATGTALLATSEQLTRATPWPQAPLLLAGCGSSRHLARCAAALAGRHGRRASATAASALWLRPEQCVRAGERPLVVGISRSGETTEVVRAIEVAAHRGLETFALTTAAPSALLAAAANGLALAHLQERSVVMTHTFGCMLMALLRLSGASAESVSSWAGSVGRRLPDILTLARESAGASRVRRFVFLGSGAFAPLADEAQLKLQETAQAEAYGFDAWEFRHGPIALVDPATLVVWLGGDPADAGVLGDARALGGRTLELPSALGVAAATSQEELALQAATFGQAVACLRAEALGRDPDRPPHLGQVVQLKPLAG